MFTMKISVQENADIFIKKFYEFIKNKHTHLIFICSFFVVYFAIACVILIAP